MGTTGIHLSHQQAGIIRRYLLPLMITLSLVASQLVLVATPPASAAAFANTLPFEIDGNAFRDGPADEFIDWDTVQGAGWVADEFNSNQDITFTGGSAENSLTQNWSFTRSRATPAKSDLVRTFAAGGFEGGQPHLYFGFVMFDPGQQPSFSGNMEFNQSEETITYPVSGGGTISLPKRTPGDVLVAGEFTPNQSNVGVYEWTATGWVARPGAATGAISADTTIPLPATIGGGEAGPRRFVEAKVNLGQLFGASGCASFASAYAKGRTTGANALDGTLVDVTEAIPIDLDFCAELDIRKVTTAGGQTQGLAGAKFEVRDDEGDLVLACTTGDDGFCPDPDGKLQDLEPGDYTVTEIAPPPGYRFSSPRVQDVDLDAFGDESVVFDNPPISYEIDVDPEDVTNAVTFPHDFDITLTTDFIFDYDTGTVVAESQTPGDTEFPLPGATVDLVWSGEPGGSEIIAIRDAASPSELADVAGTTTTTCTTDADGTCTVRVLSNTVGGPGTLTASYDTPFGGSAASDPAHATEGRLVGSIADSGMKSWIGYDVALSGDADNPLTEPHTFTATVSEIDRDGEASPAGAGVTVTFGWEGPDGSTLDADTCVTDDSGTCQVTASAPDAAGKGTLSVTQVAGQIVPGEPLVIDYEGDDQVTSVKTWWDYRVSIDGDSTNPLGEEHDFIVTVERNDGDGWGPVPDGTTISGDDLSWDSDIDSEIATNGCADPGTVTVDGVSTCTVTVETDEVGSGTLTITGISGTTLGDYLEGASFGYEVPEVDATKTWVDWEASISLPAENPVDTEHTFTIDASVYDDASGGYVPVPDGTTVGLDFDTSAVTVEANTCATGTTGGRCTLTVSSTTVQTLDVTVASIDSTEIDDGGTARLVTDVELADQPGSSKTWIDYRVVADEDATNLAGDAHPFTLTAQQQRPGEDWTALPGVSIELGLADGSVGAITGDTCDQTDTDGRCTVTVNSSIAGTATVVATGIDGIDLLDGETATSTTSWDVDVDEAAQAKTWLVYDVTLDGDAVNNLGDPHPFVATVTVDDGTGPVAADQAEVAGSFAWATPTQAPTPVTCTTDATGTCELVVAAPTADGDPIPGQGTLTLTGIDHTYTGEEGPSASFEVDLSGTSGLDAEFTAPSASKIWIDYQLNVSPDQATNLLPSEPTHEFRVALTSSDTGAAPIAGQEIALTLDSTVATITAIEDGEIDEDGLGGTCVTDEFGTCTVTATTTSPGTAQLNASFTTTVGEASFELSDSGDKLWTTFRVRVTPDQAQNLLGTPHLFSVYVEQTDDGVEWYPVEGANPELSVAEPAFLVEGSDTCASDGTDDQGRCEVLIDSAVTGFFTLTADYEGVVGEQSAGFSDSGEKQWVTYQVDVAPDIAENLTNTDHVFTVTVSVDEGEGLTPVVGATPDVALADGSVGTITDTDCDEGTDEDGTCTVTITSATPGTSTLVATYLGTAGIGDGGELEAAEFSDSGDKLWETYAVEVDPGEAINALGDPHTFTATLTRDTGDGPVPAAGQELDLAISGPGTITSIASGEVAEDGRSGTCTTDASGSCEVVIVSDEVGTTVLSASYDAVVGETTGTFSDQGTKFWTAIELVKTALVEVGEDGLKGVIFDADAEEPLEITYEYLITNTGPVPLTVTSLEDDVLGTVTLEDPTVLEPGASTTATAVHTVTAEDAAAGSIFNVAVVTGEASDGTVVEATDDEEVFVTEVLAGGSIDLVKEALVAVGEDGLKVVEVDADGDTVVTYRFTITNTGESPLEDLVLVDDKMGTIELPGTSLAPGASMVVEADYVVTDDDIGAGFVVNVGTVTAVDQVGTELIAEDDERVDLVEVAPVASGIDLVKEALVEVGDDGLKVVDLEADGDTVVRYRFTITNIGNSTIDDLVLVDDKIGTIELPGTSLAPGESMVAEADYVIAADDAAAGFVVNVGTVTGVDEAGNEVTDDDDERIEVMEVLAEVVVAQPEPEVEVMAAVKQLPRTGADTWMVLALGALLAALGAAVLLLTPRRRTS